MSANLKPANAAVRILREKLQALAERGIDGERAAAQRKLARLEARFDFSGSGPAGDPAETPDLFRGTYKRSKTGRRILSFGGQEPDVANAVKWAIESTAGISCSFRGAELWAEANPATAKRLSKIANHVAQSFRVLLERFSTFDGVHVTDRAAFVMGLYDGMMNQTRHAGQRLPSLAHPRKTRPGMKPGVSAAAHLGVHPYTLALGLGKQIRLSVPVEEIAAELAAACAGVLPEKTVRR